MSIRFPSFISSFLVKLGMLAAGSVCVYFIGWPTVSDQMGPDGFPEGKDRPLFIQVDAPSGKAGDLPTMPLLPDVLLPKATENAEVATAHPSEVQEQTVLPRLEVLDVNNATQEELEHLPGVGTVLAGRIIAFRKTHGPFEQIEDLTRVHGIGHKRLEQLRSLVQVKSRKA